MCPAGVYEIPDDAPEEGQRRRDRQLHELRAVRGDHGQGRAPDDARGRRRAAVPGHLSAPAALGGGPVTPARPRCSFAAPCARARLLAPSPSCLALPAGARPRRRPPPRQALGCRAGRRPPSAPRRSWGPCPGGRDPSALDALRLFERVPPATGFAAVKAPSLGVWQKSTPGRASSGFVFTQRVAGADRARLVPGAGVRFRWYGRAGSRRARPRARARSASSPICARTCARAPSTPPAAPLPDQATYALDSATTANGGRRVRRRADRRRRRAAAPARGRARAGGAPRP